ncbi:hypothetical protein ACWGKI_11345, partial [Isoptericola sp. NPDC055881]
MLNAEDKPPPRKALLLLKILGLTALLAVVPTIVTIYAVNALVGGPVRDAVGIFVADDGDALAAELGERVAAGIADDIEPSYDEPADAAEIVQRRAVVSPRVPDGTADVSYTVLPLAWHGSSGDDDGARIDLAVSVDVPAVNSVMGDAGRTSGSSTTCWRYAVRSSDPDDVADHDKIECPSDLSPSQAPPTPSAPASLDVKASEQVLQVLDELPDDAAPDDATTALRAVFPGVDVIRAERAADELVAVVGGTDARASKVGVRPDGGPPGRVTAIDRVQREPRG